MKIRAIVAGALMMMSASGAKAAVTVFTDFPSWFTAVAAVTGAISIETFAGNHITSSLSFTTAGAPAHGNISSNRFNDVVDVASRSTTFSFGGNQNAFGGNFDLRPGGAGQGILLTLVGPGASSVDVSPIIPRTNAGGFFGILSDAAFTSVKLSGGSSLTGIQETYNVDNISFAASAVPEPGTWLMMLAGFGGLAFAFRRRTSAQA